MDRLILPYMQALGMLGIQAHMREIDSALYQKRLDNFDYDMTTFIYSTVTIPGTELDTPVRHGAASEVGSENYPGVRSNAVDSLIHSALPATTLDDLQAATHALDRVLIYSFIWCRSTTRRVTHRLRPALGFPTVVPTSYQYEDWVIDFWYREAPAARPPPPRRPRPTEDPHAYLHFQATAADGADADRRRHADFRRHAIRSRWARRTGDDATAARLAPGGEGGGGGGGYHGSQGVDPQQVEQIKKQFGFDKPPLERYVLMLKHYATFQPRPVLLSPSTAYGA